MKGPSKNREPARILLISYKYAPYPGVAAHRWTKLTKYLAQLGHAIDVLTVDWGEPCVASPNIHVHSLQTRYPLRLRYKTELPRFLTRLRNGLFRYGIDPLLFDRDEASGWGPILLPKAASMIREQGVEVVVATGGPFYSNIFASELKTLFPKIKLIQDFRDTWAHNPYTYSKRQREKILKLQNETIANADRLVFISQTLAAQFGADTRKSVVISNGYDPQDFSKNFPAPKKSSLKELVHLGNITNGRDIPFRKLLDYLKQTEGSVPPFRVTQIGSVESGLRKDLEKGYGDLIRRGLLSLLPSLSRAAALEKLCQGDVALQLTSPEFDYALSTKIYEYGYLGIPVLCLHFGGEIERLMADHDLGLSIHLGKEEVASAIGREWDLLVERERVPKLEEYSFARLAMRYSGLIQELATG